MENRPNPVALEFGLAVRRLRMARGWSLDDLAGRADISRYMLIGIEHGRRNPSLLIIGKIATALEATPDELLKPAFDSSEI